MLKLIVSGLLMLALQNPQITKLKNEKFSIVHERGAGYACTVFDQKTGEGLPYTFRSCHLLDPSLGGYEDDWDLVKPEDADWDIYAQVYYENARGVADMRESNHLKVHR